jgi:hypothetical protein
MIVMYRTRGFECVDSSHVLCIRPRSIERLGDGAAARGECDPGLKTARAGGESVVGRTHGRRAAGQRLMRLERTRASRVSSRGDCLITSDAASADSDTGSIIDFGPPPPILHAPDGSRGARAARDGRD